MIFRKKNEELVKIMLRDKIIPCKESTQFMKMTLHVRLNWEEYINRIKDKAKRVLKTIRVVVGEKWGGDHKSLKNVV